MWKKKELGTKFLKISHIISFLSAHSYSFLLIVIALPRVPKLKQQTHAYIELKPSTVSKHQNIFA
jgi:hypothetical protein